MIIVQRKLLKHRRVDVPWSPKVRMILMLLQHGTGTEQRHSFKRGWVNLLRRLVDLVLIGNMLAILFVTETVGRASFFGSVQHMQ